jgi:hypothetical protein
MIKHCAYDVTVKIVTKCECFCIGQLNSNISLAWIKLVSLFFAYNKKRKCLGCGKKKLFYNMV